MVITVFLSLIGMISCVNEVEEEIIPSAGTDPVCNTETVTFSGNVQPLIQGNCLPCHSASTLSGGINLEGYENIKNVAQSGKLVGVISHSPGFSPMPKGRAKLATCDIESIKKWIADGTPQN